MGKVMCVMCEDLIKVINVESDYSSQNMASEVVKNMFYGEWNKVEHNIKVLTTEYFLDIK